MKNQAENLRWLRSELERAYLAARRGKTSKPEVIDFDKVCKQELDALAREIHTREYKPKPSTTFIVNKPVKREIFAAAFRDRIVHHFLFNQVSGWWDARFIEDNYSCRKGKGTLYGISRLDHHIRSVSNNYQTDAYVLKLDIQGYLLATGGMARSTTRVTTATSGRVRPTRAMPITLSTRTSIPVTSIRVITTTTAVTELGFVDSYCML